MKPAAPPVLCAARLPDQIRERIRDKHYSLRTELAYVQWVRVFVKWYGVQVWLNDGFGASSWTAAQGRKRQFIIGCFRPGAVIETGKVN